MKPFSVVRFEAMSCPCEVLLDTTDDAVQAKAHRFATDEAARIEAKFSRFRPDSVVYRINQNGGQPTETDEETAALLDYAAQCYDISEGLFDITAVKDRPLVGWNRVSWKRPTLLLQKGMQIDLGGICKEYAADRILSILSGELGIAVLVNLGGDIAAAGERLWSVGIEDTARPGSISRTVHLRQGGIATSGTTKRPGHIVSPKSGQPITDSPQSVTVAAKTCTEAGFWSTLAILQGAKAESFLNEQALEFWCSRV